jgi:hypothetical protein
MRSPNDVQFLPRQRFIESIEHIRIEIVSENEKSKRVPISEIWLKCLYKNEVNRLIF